MRKLIYLVAVTVDGFIAAEDGSFSAFFTEGPQADDLRADFPEALPAVVRAASGLTEVRRFDAVLMGRASYDVALREGVTSPYSHLEQYVFSTSLKISPDKAVQVVADNALNFVRDLKERPGRDLWLCGGGKLASTLSSEIDELILKVSPVLLGAGVPLFARALPVRPLRLLERKLYDNGFMRLHYALL